MNIRNVIQLMLTPLDATFVQDGSAKAAKMRQLRKLKQIFNKCKTIYFLCQSCDQLQSEHSCEDVASKYLCEADRNNDSLNMIEEVLGRTVKGFESKLETLIDKKLDQKLKIIESFDENIKEQGSGSASDPLVILSFADKLKGGTTDFGKFCVRQGETRTKRRNKEQRTL